MPLLFFSTRLFAAPQGGLDDPSNLEMPVFMSFHLRRIYPEIPLPQRPIFTAHPPVEVLQLNPPRHTSLPLPQTFLIDTLILFPFDTCGVIPPPTILLKRRLLWEDSLPREKTLPQRRAQLFRVTSSPLRRLPLPEDGNPPLFAVRALLQLFFENPWWRCPFQSGRY